MDTAPRSAASAKRAPGTDRVADSTVTASRIGSSKIALIACAVLVVIGLLALGTWQLVRLQWKLDLIARVDQRIHAVPVPVPARENWRQINAANDEYRHVQASGKFLYEHTVRVQATTVLGGGFWLLTPLRDARGDVVMVNRGFIAATPGKQSQDNPRDDATGASTVTGLLRMSEPGGGFLRANDPASNRWHSRDVQAIATARGLLAVAPYFIDADTQDGSPSDNNALQTGPRPIGGLTVIAFQNNHLVYAITWYVLALMVAGFSLRAVREGRGSSRSDGLD